MIGKLSAQHRAVDFRDFPDQIDLKTALEDWIKLWNDNARPFKWTKTADRICRYCSRISEPAH